MNERIRELRKSLNLTLDQFGQILGLQKSAISKIELGRTTITEQNINLILKTDWNGKLVNEGWLRTGDGDMFLELPEEDEYFKVATQLSNDPIAIAIMLEYAKWDENTKKQFMTSLKNIVKVYEEHMS